MECDFDDEKERNEGWPDRSIYWYLPAGAIKSKARNQNMSLGITENKHAHTREIYSTKRSLKRLSVPSLLWAISNSPRMLNSFCTDGEHEQDGQSLVQEESRVQVDFALRGAQ